MSRSVRVRRGVATVVALAVASALLVGCSTGGKQGTTTISVMVGATDLSKAQIAEFEKANPDIKINTVLYDATRLNTMLAAGNPPDITFGNAVGSANFNARGLAADLEPYLKTRKVLKESDLQPVNDAFRWNGKSSGKGDLYGIVKDWSQDNALWYNTALFDAAGVPYLSDTTPISYDQLLDIAKKLTVAEGGTTNVYGLGMEWQWSLYGPLAAMVEQQGASLYNRDMTKIDFTSDAAQKALQWFVDYGKAGVGPTSLNPLADGSDYSTFAAKRMAISQDGYWFGGNFAAANALQTVRFAPAPVMGDTPAAMSFGGAGLWIPAKAKHKDAAWKFMEYFMAGSPAKARASSGWGLPSLKSLADKLPTTLPFQKQASAVVQSQIKYTKPLPDSPYISATELQNTIDKYLQLAIKGNLTVKDAGVQLTAALNKDLAQGVDQLR